jgi:hypothetical protein
MEKKDQTSRRLQETGCAVYVWISLTLILIVWAYAAYVALTAPNMTAGERFGSILVVPFALAIIAVLIAPFYYLFLVLIIPSAPGDQNDDSVNNPGQAPSAPTDSN